MIKKLTFICLAVSAFSNIFAQSADAAVGNWTPPERDSIINVYKCGDKYCGKTLCLKEPNDANGQPKLDKENKDEKLRSRPTLGLTFMTGFVSEGNGVYVDGKIYNPRDGATYCGKMTAEGNTLSLKGKICWTPIGKTNTWTKIDSTAGFTCVK